MIEERGEMRGGGRREVSPSFCSQLILSQCRTIIDACFQSSLTLSLDVSVTSNEGFAMM